MAKKTTKSAKTTTTQKPASKTEPKAQAKKAAKYEPKQPVSKQEHAATAPEARATASEPAKETKAAPGARDPWLPAPGARRAVSACLPPSFWGASRAVAHPPIVRKRRAMHGAQKQGRHAR